MKYNLLDNESGKTTEFTTTVDIEIKGNNLFVNFEAHKSQMFSYSDKFNDDIFLGDVCEIFLCTSGDIKHYYELEVAPNNTRWAGKIYNDLVNKEQVTQLEDYYKSNVRIENNNYFVEMIIPLDKIGYDQNKKIMFNAYRIETEGGITELHLLAVNPTFKHAFHVPQKFIELEL